MPTDKRLVAVKTGLQNLGYSPNLLLTNYKFSNLSDADEGKGFGTIDLAAFAVNPPSYSSVCFGVVLAPPSGITAQHIADYRFLGAPRLLVIDEDQTQVWSLTAEGLPTTVDTFQTGWDGSELAETISRCSEWEPSAVLRGKSVRPAPGSPQLDFYGAGLLPAIESEVQSRLDALLTDAVSASEQVYKDRETTEPDADFHAGLFRLVFRFVAAKMLGDRGMYPKINWTSPNAAEVVDAVEKFYFSREPSETWAGAVIDDPAVRNAAWDKIRRGLRFDNLSVEALAYVYENTFVNKNTRRDYGTHATPREVAEFALRHLPIEELPQEERTIFEPFAGAAPFLVAGLARLRALLPAGWDNAVRHEYFVRMLHGMELDTFAHEVARYSLILADYPNPNGWRIAQGDIFGAGLSEFERLRSNANIILCNPPYESFTAEERTVYGGKEASNKAVRALNLILQKPPKMLGFVLPRVAVNGRSYRAAHEILSQTYGSVDLLELPRGIFKKSTSETVLLLAHGANETGEALRRIARVERAEYPVLLDNNAVVWHIQSKSGSDLYNILRQRSERNPLSLVSEAYLGIEYRTRVEKTDRVSDTEREGFKPGLDEAKGHMRPYAVPEFTYINTNVNILKGQTFRHSWENSKVIINRAYSSRGYWVCSAMLDYEGLACTRQFYGIWPRSEAVSIELIAATLNGPVANVWIKQNSTGRDNQLRHIREVPMPILSATASELIAYCVERYLNMTAQLDDADSGTNEEMTSEAQTRIATRRDDLILRIDAGILSGYDFTPEIERELLARFDGQPRPGTNLTGYNGERWEAAKAAWRTDLREAEQNNRRHELIDQKYLNGLSVEEQSELADLTNALNEQDADFYSPRPVVSSSK